MRNKKEILEDIENSYVTTGDGLILELLLDIRELLMLNKVRKY